MTSNHRYISKRQILDPVTSRTFSFSFVEMLYSTDSKAFKNFLKTSFTCTICSNELELRRKMPQSSLGCGCSGEICVSCFCQDLQARVKPYWVNEHGGSEWETFDELQDHLWELFMESEETQALSEEDSQNDELVNALFETYLDNHLFPGKKCPFCACVCLWNRHELPQISPTTGKLTFRRPRYTIKLPNEM